MAGGNKEGKKKKKFPWLLILIILVLIFFFACDDDSDSYNSSGNGSSSNTNVPKEEDEASKSEYSEDDTWAVYWYLCGSDLESDSGAATEDLQEMMEATELPENVKVVIETGGALQWQNDYMDARYTERYLYDSQGLSLISQEPMSNMGDPATLQSFLSFCKQNYDADHKMLIFWDHGGGSVSGVCFDEIYNYDSLTLNEMRQAISSVYEPNTEKPPIDIVGFDACLMATVDTVDSLQGLAKYMIASEETEPGNGWYYTDWISSLAEHPGITAQELCVSVCDSFIKGCEMYWTEDETTLSVVNLRKTAPLLEAYNQLGAEALRYAYKDPSFFVELSRDAGRAVNYGGNTKSEGYTNMIDLGDLIIKSEELWSENGQNVLKAIDDCIVYKVSGDYRTAATGLSCYYSFNNDTDDYDMYTQIASSDAFAYFYGYELYGVIDQGAYSYLSKTEAAQPVRSVPTFEAEEPEDIPLEVDDEGYAVMKVDSDTAAMAESIQFMLAYVDEESDLILYLGTDNDIDSDWDKGIFKDNFRGVWGAIDKHIVYMEISEEGDDYNIYTVPILLNGEECNLHVYYDYNDNTYRILGAKRAIDEETGMADKNLIILKKGDEITTRLYASTISGDDDPELFECDTFKVKDKTKFAEIDLDDGSYMMMFELTDVRNNSIYSEPTWINLEDGEIFIDVE